MDTLRKQCALLFILALGFVQYSFAEDNFSTIFQNEVTWVADKRWSSDAPFNDINEFFNGSSDSFGLTGGTYTSLLEFKVSHPKNYVIDFRNSALIGKFDHWLFDVEGRLVAHFAGGLLSNEPNPYFLRNGREAMLTPGHYYLITSQASQFNIAPPTPFIMAEEEYIREINLGNTITLLGLGVFVGLFFYYLVLSVTRLSLVDLSYALFIAGNLVFNATTLHVLPQLMGVQWYGGASWPILFSNIAYIVFVMSLLQISRQADKYMWWIGATVIALFSSFVLLSFFMPHWQNEFNRFSVGLFLLFGVIAGIYKSLKRSIVARWYLVANAGFVVLGSIAISQEQIADLKTIYMSHIGLIAVTWEVLFLSCVIAYQMTRLQHEKTRALKQAKDMLEIAHTDALTQLPNRYAMEKKLKTAASGEGFIYIDLDGLKSCNDNYGHEMGDELLVTFSERLMAALPNNAELYRISGDEFGLVFSESNVSRIKAALDELDQTLRTQFLPSVGVSYGAAHFQTNGDYEAVVREADKNMFNNKKRKYQQLTEYEI
ncbi:sensor domain-containing diguanylate cyclase [Vibrio variabilis]|uniref:GGDEF domain-containing protein n=1 Tax=Vibrio variabilis TaxID=990271 RepID=UPI00068E942E|nr:diguanylate cyclase [Vibrio variabilis]